MHLITPLPSWRLSWRPAITFALFIAALASCTPTRDDCDPGNDDSSCGGGGHAGGGGGAGAPPAGPCSDLAAIRAADLPGCAAHADVQSYERDFLRSRCGSAVCHRKVSFPPHMPGTGQDYFLKMVGVSSKACTDDPYIDLERPERSFLLIRCRDDEPRCPSQPDGRSVGAPMPSEGDRLSVDEIACLEAYVTTIAAACR